MVKKVCLVGLGYVGLPTAVAFSEAGFEVVGADIDKRKVDSINSGRSYIPEILPDKRIKDLVDGKKLKATNDVAGAVKESDAILITVPTPIDNVKNPDLSAVISAAESISKGLGKGKLVILESTVYPGVTEEVVQPILEKSGFKAGKDFGLAYCPERYNPGDSEHDIGKIKRVVGAIDKKWLDVAHELYSKITTEEVRKVSNIKTAEAAKVIENIQRDLNIALMNELALIFDRIGVDTREVIEAASTKWNFHRYWPGPGVGGHCLPVDPYYLVHKAKELGYNPQVITAGREVNDSMAGHVVNLLIRGLNKKNKSVKDSKIAIFGVAYKGNIGDSRESPSKRIIAELKKMNARLVAYDPFVDEDEIKKMGAVPAKDMKEAAMNADAIIIVADHDKFKNLDLRKFFSYMRTPVIVDSRGFVDVKTAKEIGFVVERI